MFFPMLRSNWMLFLISMGLIIHLETRTRGNNFFSRIKLLLSSCILNNSSNATIRSNDIETKSQICNTFPRNKKKNSLNPIIPLTKQIQKKITESSKENFSSITLYPQSAYFPPKQPNSRTSIRIHSDDVTTRSIELGFPPRSLEPFSTFLHWRDGQFFKTLGPYHVKPATSIERSKR